MECHAPSLSQAWVNNNLAQFPFFPMPIGTSGEIGPFFLGRNKISINQREKQLEQNGGRAAKIKTKQDPHTI